MLAPRRSQLPQCQQCVGYPHLRERIVHPSADQCGARAVRSGGCDKVMAVEIRTGQSHEQSAFR